MRVNIDLNKMATGGEYPSISKTSEEIFDSECFNCSQDGRHVEAEVFCVECGNNMCRGCLKDHNKFPQLLAHQIKDKSAVTLGTTQGAPHPPTEKCREHDGRLIDTFCSHHDAVCCSVCVSENHRLCPDVSYIPKVASGISTSIELQDAHASTKTIKTRLDKLREARQENLEEIRKQRNEALERAAMYKDELIEHVEELGKRTAAEIMDKCKQIEDTINDELDELSKDIETLEDMDGKLKNMSGDETKLFVHLKTCKQYLSTREKLEKTSSIAFGPDIFAFDIDPSIEMYFRGLTALGHGNYLSKGDIKAEQLSDEDMKSSGEWKTCRITGICNLDDGSLIIVDNENKRLKKLDKSFQIVDRCGLSSTPWDVCQTGSTEVAVTMWREKKVQFVSVGQVLALTRSFPVTGEADCTGLACRKGNLYVSRPMGDSASVQVYDITGTLLQTIQKDTTGASMFGIPLHIAFSTRTSNILVMDYKGFIIMDKYDQLVASVTDPDLAGCYGVCVLPGDQLLICGRNSDNIIQFDAQGKKVRTLLTAADGIKKPEVLHFVRDKSRLVVGMANSDKIKVYSIVKQ